MGSCTIVSEWNALRSDSERIVQVKITGLCSASDCLGFVRPRNRSMRWRVASRLAWVSVRISRSWVQAEGVMGGVPDPRTIIKFDCTILQPRLREGPRWMPRWFGCEHSPAKLCLYGIGGLLINHQCFTVISATTDRLEMTQEMSPFRRNAWLDGGYTLMRHSMEALGRLSILSYVKMDSNPAFFTSLALFQRPGNHGNPADYCLRCMMSVWIQCERSRISACAFSIRVQTPALRCMMSVWIHCERSRIYIWVLLARCT